MRAMTWNLWWRFGPWEQRRDAILAVLRDLRPDAVGMQEVWGQGGNNLAGWLAEQLGMHWAWAAVDTPDRWQKRIGDDTIEVGNAVLSRWPIVHTAQLRLPTAGGQDDGRLVLHAMLDAPEYQIPFFTTHLNSALHESAIRCRQVAALAGFVAEHRGDGPFPPVVTGDYNAWPDSDELRLLGGYRTAPAVAGQILFDAWEYADPGAPSATWDVANPFVATTFEPNLRCDYIHVGVARTGRARPRAHRTAGG